LVGYADEARDGLRLLETSRCAVERGHTALLAAGLNRADHGFEASLCRPDARVAASGGYGAILETASGVRPAGINGVMCGAGAALAALRELSCHRVEASLRIRLPETRRASLKGCGDAAGGALLSLLCLREKATCR